MDNKKYQHLFFDLDHTLWDFEKNSIAALRVCYDTFKLNEKGVPEFEIFEPNYHAHNDRLWERFRKGNITRELLRWKRVYVTLMDYKIFDEMLAKEISEKYLEQLQTQTHVFHFAIELLEYCKSKGYGIHMITNGFENVQIEKMKNSNMYHFFDNLITSERAMCLKPHKEIYDYAFTNTGANATNSLMIGDGLQVDVLGALNVGMDAVWFNPKHIQEKGNYTYQISHLKELMEIL
jgi:putative hydrolase of the HAD superfamily